MLTFVFGVPTVTDMLANAAFLIGLSRWLAAQDQRWTYRLSFERAEHGFYRAAQHGLAAELTWPFGDSSRLRALPAAELVPELLPAARQGLSGAGVAVEEANHLLGVIAAGRTGAVSCQRPHRRSQAHCSGSDLRKRSFVVLFDRGCSCVAFAQRSENTSLHSSMGANGLRHPTSVLALREHGYLVASPASLACGAWKLRWAALAKGA
jgi:hypothetical protein